LSQKVIDTLPALLVAVVIWILSSQSTLPQPKGILGIDKVQHLAAYAVLAFCIGFRISSAGWKRRPAFFFFLTAVLASAYGAVDEFHQSFVPGRDASVWDWIADALGAVIGAAIAFFTVPLIRRGSKRRNNAPPRP
jgi:VanZ family protein